MNDAAERPWVKAGLIPVTWGVTCPTCGQVVDVEKVEDDDAGVFYGAEECCVVECESCDVVIEIQGVRLVHTTEPPWRNRRS